MNPRNMFCGRTRREFLWQAGGGFTSLGLVDMLSRDGFFSGSRPSDDPNAGPLAPKPPHHAPKAKACIFLFMYGGPSHVDTFDYKPKLYPLDGKTIDIQTKGRGGSKSKGRVVGRACGALGRGAARRAPQAHRGLVVEEPHERRRATHLDGRGQLCTEK